MNAQSDDERWADAGIRVPFLLERAKWLGAPRQLHGNSLRFFEQAGTLIRLSRHDYPLASVAFFHTLPGLEQALRLHFGKKTGTLHRMLFRACQERVIHDRLFEEIVPFTLPFAGSVKELIGHEKRTYSEELALLLPKLRNQYFHGTYLMAPDYLHLAIQVRQIADALKTMRI